MTVFSCINASNDSLTIQTITTSNYQPYDKVTITKQNGEATIKDYYKNVPEKLRYQTGTEKQNCLKSESLRAGGERVEKESPSPINGTDAIMYKKKSGIKVNKYELIFILNDK